MHLGLGRQLEIHRRQRAVGIARVHAGDTLTVALDLGAAGPADRELVSLKVVGIEDLIVEEIASMWRQRAPSEEAAARARVLTELGRKGADCVPITCVVVWLGKRAARLCSRADGLIGQGRMTPRHA